MNKYKYLIMSIMLFLPVSGGAESKDNIDGKKYQSIMSYTEFKWIENEEPRRVVLPKCIMSQERLSFINESLDIADLDRGHLGIGHLGIGHLGIRYIEIARYLTNEVFTAVDIDVKVDYTEQNQCKCIMSQERLSVINKSLDEGRIGVAKTLINDIVTTADTGVKVDDTEENKDNCIMSNEGLLLANESLDRGSLEVAKINEVATVADTELL